MSSEELKPCPFCGGDVSFHKDEECPGCHLIQCGQCRAFFDFATGADPGNDCASVDSLRAAIAPMWNARAQLSAIQGGMGEVVEVRALQWLDTGHYRKKPPQFGYNPHDWNPLMTVAQHQRITAAMAAEVERWERSFRDIHEPALRDAHAYIQELRAELAEVKGQEAACFVVGKLEKTAVIAPPLPVGTKLYALPPASPDVEGLVKALEADFPLLDDNGLDESLNHCEWSIQQERKRLHTALSTWRQAHELES